jgi:hypothetical protein
MFSILSRDTMKAVFSDMQDPSNPLDGAAIHDRQELLALLERLRDRDPFVCELVGENGYKLKMGIGPGVACVQHGPSDGDTPYLMAVGPQKHCDQEYVEFLLGDTPTPIAQRFCLPFEMAGEIASYFVETGQRWPDAAWEEI